MAQSPRVNLLMARSAMLFMLPKVAAQDSLLSHPKLSTRKDVLNFGLNLNLLKKPLEHAILE